MSRYAPIPLRVGQRVRLREGGPVMTVERVTPCAAYVRSEATRRVVIPAKVDGQGREMQPAREFDAHEGGLHAIACEAFVFDAEEP